MDAWCYNERFTVLSEQVSHEDFSAKPQRHDIVDPVSHGHVFAFYMTLVNIHKSSEGLLFIISLRVTTSKENAHDRQAFAVEG